MLNARHPLVIATFKEESQAREIIEVLREAKFRDEQIGIAVWRDDTLIHRLKQELVDMEVSAEEVARYMHELEVGKTLVWVKYEERYWETANILHSGRVHKLSTFKSSDVPPHVATSDDKGRIEANGTSEKSSTGTNVEEPRLQMNGEASSETIPDWQRLLTDAGIDRLLDELP